MHSVRTSSANEKRYKQISFHSEILSTTQDY